MSLLWLLIAILVILWLVGYAGPSYYSGIPRTGSLIHVILVVALILVLLMLLGVI